MDEPLPARLSLSDRSEPLARSANHVSVSGSTGASSLALGSTDSGRLSHLPGAELRPFIVRLPWAHGQGGLCPPATFDSQAFRESKIDRMCSSTSDGARPSPAESTRPRLLLGQH